LGFPAKNIPGPEVLFLVFAYDGILLPKKTMQFFYRRRLFAIRPHMQDLGDIAVCPGQQFDLIPRFCLDRGVALSLQERVA
jgi:hypothetical protein